MYFFYFKSISNKKFVDLYSSRYFHSCQKVFSDYIFLGVQFSDLDTSCQISHTHIITLQALVNYFYIHPQFISPSSLPFINTSNGKLDL